MKKAWITVALCVLAANVALAVPGDGLTVGNLTISPYVDITATYDDNVLLLGTDEKDDFFLEIIPGVAFLKETDRMILQGRGWGQFRRYQDFDRLDSDGFGERVDLLIGTEDDSLLRIGQRFARTRDYELYSKDADEVNIEIANLKLAEDRTERVKRDEFNIGAAIGRWFGEKLRVDIGVGHDAIDYDTSLLFDWDETSGQIEARYQFREKTAALITAQYTVQEADGIPDDMVFYLGRLGIYQRVTGKTMLKFSAGFERFETNVKAESTEGLGRDIISYDAAGIWVANPKLDFHLSARTGIQPATQYERNTKAVLLLAIGARYQLTDTVQLSTGVSHRNDDYTARVPVDGVFMDKERDLYGLRARVDYRPHARFFEVFLEGTYEDVDDTLEDDFRDYAQMRVSSGVFVRY
jgi:hypothetical protein